MKSILINAQTQEITEIVLSKENYLKDTYLAIGNECTVVETGVYINEAEAIMIDEEGYFKEGLLGFTYDGRFFYGNAVIWNCDNEGNAMSCESTIESIALHVQWVDAENSAMFRESVLDNPTIIYFNNKQL